jgi:hypothetical protein
MHRILLLLLLLAASCNPDEPRSRRSGDGPGPTSDPLTARERAIADALDEVMLGCPERVWPSYDWAEVQVLLVDNAGRRAVLWNDQEAGDATLVDYATLSPEFHSYYTFSELRGVPTLGLSLDDTQRLNDFYEQYGIPSPGDHALIFAFHEGFHYFGQEGFTLGGGSGERDPSYPLESEPRFLRQSLLEAVAAGDAAAAAYWDGRFQSELPDEAQALAWVDRIEGSAAYVEMAGMVLSRLGCGATEAEVAAAIDADLDLYVSYSPDAGIEPYDLGFAAGRHLRANGPELWERRVELGETPVAVMTDGAGALPQSESASLRAFVEQTIADENADLAPVLDPFVLALGSSSNVRLPLPYGWMAGSFSMSGGYYLAEVAGEPHVLVDVAATFDTADGQLITLANATVVDVASQPCDSGFALVLVLDPSDVTDNGDGSFDVVAPGITARGLRAGSVTATEPWLCPL